MKKTEEILETVFGAYDIPEWMGEDNIKILFLNICEVNILI